MTKIGINGFGRIGRLDFSSQLNDPEAEIVGINGQFVDAEYMAYMVKYDSVHGRFKGTAEVSNGKLVVNGRRINVSLAMASQGNSLGLRRQVYHRIHWRLYHSGKPPPTLKVAPKRF